MGTDYRSNKMEKEFIAYLELKENSLPILYQNAEGPIIKRLNTFSDREKISHKVA